MKSKLKMWESEMMALMIEFEWSRRSELGWAWESLDKRQGRSNVKLWATSFRGVEPATKDNKKVNRLAWLITTCFKYKKKIQMWLKFFLKSKIAKRK